MMNNAPMNFAVRLVKLGREHCDQIETINDCQVVADRALHLIEIAETITTLNDEERTVIGEMVAWHEHRDTDPACQ